jgi:hypothetical protein
VQLLKCVAVCVIAHAIPSTVEGQTDSTRASEPDTVPIYQLDPLFVAGRSDDLSGMVSTASVGRVGRADLHVRPLLREGELLETVPGMIMTQHAGGGKSNQMFVRGFNLDHGTDFATWIEGMPVNLVTHAHGQGYTDLNWLIPELVDHVEYKLGTYYAELGDFGSAGGAHFRLRRSLARPLFVSGIGQNGFARVVGATSRTVGSGDLLAGGEIKTYDGPWERPQDLDKLSGMIRYTWSRDDNLFSLLALGYSSRWGAADQVPLRAVRSGRLGRFAQVDTTLGGSTSRYSLSGSWVRATGAGSQRADAYAIRYDLDLFSNFTYRLENPVAGDQIRQRDRARWVVGGDAVHSQPARALDREHTLELGVQSRADLIDVALDRTSERALLQGVRADRVTQWSAGAFVQATTQWTERLRTVLGFRGDMMRFDVESDRPENSGTRTDGNVSPKASLIFAPTTATELYASAGTGFHSNDARGSTQTVDPATDRPVEPLTPIASSFGAEIGVRATPLSGWRTTLVLWTIALESELVFVGDAGANEASDPSRRYGVSWANFYRVGSGWTADLDISFTRARIDDVPAGRDRIPGALERVLATGVTWAPEHSGPFATVRLRHFGSFPLTEDNGQRGAGSSIVNLALGYRIGEARVSVSALNVLDADDSDIEYWYPSRLEGEALGGVEDVHFHPVEPRQLRLSVSWGL